jgi:hypothetical protein
LFAQDIGQTAKRREIDHNEYEERWSASCAPRNRGVGRRDLIVCEDLGHAVLVWAEEDQAGLHGRIWRK